ncbi:MAG: hypothetical protein P8080_09060 [Gammaproteobacteria bacterium]
MRYLIGVDDTDNLESRGTGFRARTLGRLLTEAGIGELKGVSRHQLFVHDDIAYTSHNSALCLDVQVAEDRADELHGFCRSFLIRESAPGSDAGLCITPWEEVPDAIMEFGRAAKSTVLARRQAEALAAGEGVLLEGLTGDHGGVIGALACVGLRRAGHDGRFVWLKGVRELSGAARASELLETTGIEVIRSLQGQGVDGDSLVRVDPWPRPVLLEGRAVLLVERPEDPDVEHDWQLLPREVIRGY